MHKLKSKQINKKKPFFEKIKFSEDFIPTEKDVSELDILDDIKQHVINIKNFDSELKEVTQEEIHFETVNEIKELEKDLLDLNDIMKNLKFFVIEKGEMLDKAEENIDKTCLKTEVAVENIKKAENFEIKNRRIKTSAVSGAVIGGATLGGIGSFLGFIPGLIGGTVGTIGGAISGSFIK
jgi:hypothetical protein